MDLSYFETVNDDGEVSYSRPETKSLEALKRVISLTKPARVVDKFATLYLQGAQWNWFTTYQKFLSELDEVVKYNKNPPSIGKDDNGIEVIADQKPLPIEPVRPTLMTLDEFKEANTVLFDGYNKKMGSIIMGVRVSLNKDNADGLVSIKTAYDLVGDALFPTNFVADTPDGIAKIPLNDYGEYVEFATQFLVARGGFFS
tara:strand:- start:1549 stop:2148 length:600 start_codon:yes stop_codon:yes gene_type:complete